MLCERPAQDRAHCKGGWPLKLDPGFTSHWKTERLLDRLGGDGVVALLRLWGMAQIRRRWTGLPLTAERLAAETKWKGDPVALWEAFTDPLGPWLDAEEGGTWAIHDFGQHQKQVVSLWENGKRGGRPSKNKKEEDTSSSSSSYPIRFSNENHLVLDDEVNKRLNPRRYATFQDVQKYGRGQMPPVPDECMEAFFDRMEEIGWTDDKGLPLADWRARFRRYATNWHNNRHGAADGSRMPHNPSKSKR